MREGGREGGRRDGCREARKGGKREVGKREERREEGRGGKDGGVPEGKEQFTVMFLRLNEAVAVLQCCNKALRDRRKRWQGRMNNERVMEGEE